MHDARRQPTSAVAELRPTEHPPAARRGRAPPTTGTRCRDHLRLELEHGGGPGFAAVTVATATASLVGYAQLVGGQRRAHRRARRRPGRPRRRRRSTPTCSHAAIDVVAGDGGGAVHWWVFDADDAADDAARRLGRPGARPATLLPDAASPADGAARRRRDATVRARPRRGRRGSPSTTGPSPPTPSRAAGRPTTLRQREAEPWFDPDRLPPPRARRTAGRVLLDEAARRRAPVLGRDLRDRRRSRLPGPRARPPADAGRARRHRRRGVDDRRCSTSTPTTPPRSAMYERLGFTIHRTDRAYMAEVAARLAA